MGSERVKSFQTFLPKAFSHALDVTKSFCSPNTQACNKEKLKKTKQRAISVFKVKVLLVRLYPPESVRVVKVNQTKKN